ncbi:MAG: hypothetical protein Kow00117_17650 [Phototrophicales bacterium]
MKRVRIILVALVLVVGVMAVSAPVFAASNPPAISWEGGGGW